MPKDTTKKASARAGRRHDPLHVTLTKDDDDDVRAAKAQRRRARREAAQRGGAGAADAAPGNVVSGDLSGRIIQAVKDQQDSMRAGAPMTGGKGRLGAAAALATAHKPSGVHAAVAGRGAPGGVSAAFGGGDDSDSDGSDAFTDDGLSVASAELEGPRMVRVNRAGLDGAPAAMDEWYVEGVGVTDEDERDIARFMPAAFGERRSLADMIMDRIREKDAEAAGDAPGGMQESSGPALNPKVVEAYSSVGAFLRRYKSGKLPKLFKILPSLRNWEEVVYVTEPDRWSPAAVRAATRLFASNLNPKMAQRFYNLILLPKCRDDISEFRKLNYHLYMALKKALYKPAAFYKGVLLPLCESGDCTLREATIFGSVLSKVSIPQAHSAACLLKLAELPYSPATAVFLRTLINKKYALPYRVVDALVAHFMTFMDVEGPLPVIWHQCLLAFAQRYRNDVTRDQREHLRALLKQHTHHAITYEVRRELFSGPPRGEGDDAAGAGVPPDTAITDFMGDNA